jgi:hypothetical protein
MAEERPFRVDPRCHRYARRPTGSGRGGGVPLATATRPAHPTIAGAQLRRGCRRPAGPGLHPMHVVGLPAGVVHRGHQPALYGMGRAGGGATEPVTNGLDDPLGPLRGAMKGGKPTQRRSGDREIHSLCPRRRIPLKSPDRAQPLVMKDWNRLATCWGMTVGRPSLSIEPGWMRACTRVGPLASSAPARARSNSATESQLIARR